MNNLLNAPIYPVNLTTTGFYKPNFVERAAKFFEAHISDSFIKHVDFKQNSLTRNTNLAIALVVVLGARYLSSRDENERREVLTRDLIGVLTVFKGVPLLKELAGKIMPKINGFVIKDGKNLASYDQLEDWYSIKNKCKNSFSSICDNLTQKGGNLLKIFGENSSAQENILTSKDNSILKKAKLSKAVPELLCLGFVMALLGWILPWYNIHHTKKLMAQKLNHNENTDKNSTNISNIQLSEKHKEFISNFLKNQAV